MPKLKDDFNWKNYLIAGGTNTIELFGKLLNQSDTGTTELAVSKDYIGFVYELRSTYCPSPRILNSTTSLLESLDEVINDYYLIDPPDSSDADAWSAVHSTLAEIVESTNEKMIAQEFCTAIEFYSTWLAISRPGIFYPWYFRYSYNMFELICSELAEKYGFKPLGKIPLKSNYRNRFNFYEELCQSIKQFAEENELTPEEVCAFFYDYAPKALGGVDAVLCKEEGLATPHRAFFIGGAADDIFLSQNDSGVTPWQCNPDASPGDIAVMYTTSPDSAITSLWRCVSKGFDDPFFWYYRCTYISNQELVEPLSLRVMKEDAILSDLPIVRKNMQGCQQRLKIDPFSTGEN